MLQLQKNWLELRREVAEATFLKIELNQVKKRLKAENQSDEISGWLTSTEVAA